MISYSDPMYYSLAVLLVPLLIIVPTKLVTKAAGQVVNKLKLFLLSRLK